MRRLTLPEEFASGHTGVEIFVFLGLGCLIGWCLTFTVITLKNLDAVEISSPVFRTFRKLACGVFLLLLWISVLGIAGLLLKKTLASIFFAGFLVMVGFLLTAVTTLPFVKRHKFKKNRP
jgi:hypothetical protein